jgi:hypothetical protein
MALGDEIRRNIAQVEPSERASLCRAYRAEFQNAPTGVVLFGTKPLQNPRRHQGVHVHDATQC